MEWKLKEEDGRPVFEDGKPVYIDPDGKEVALDPVGMYSKIIDLGKENKKHRERAKQLQENLKLFDGIEDLSEWKKKADEALETVTNFNEKDWLKAEKVEKLKADMKQAFKEQEREIKEQFNNEINAFKEIVSSKDAQIRHLMVSNRFATSSYFSGPDPKTILPPEIAETYFGRNFKVEETDKGNVRLVAYYDSGDPIYSRTNPGELADFEEAIAALVEKYPGKEKLLRSAGGGSGSPGGAGGTGDKDEIQELKKAHEEAVKAKDVARAIALKNQIFKLQQRQV